MIAPKQNMIPKGYHIGSQMQGFPFSEYPHALLCKTQDLELYQNLQEDSGQWAWDWVKEAGRFLLD